MDSEQERRGMPRLSRINVEAGDVEAGHAPPREEAKSCSSPRRGGLLGKMKIMGG